MRFNFVTALLLSASVAANDTSMEILADTQTDDKLSTLITTALSGAKPGTITIPEHSATDKEGETKITTGTPLNYQFHWKYACAYTKWAPTNQYLNAGRTVDLKTMTLERFGFIGMDKKCFWGMVGVNWV